ncbi:MAG: hypothetical protein HPY66_3091 [Firmicutes bacterium]|nr:hypothetical protein [Bacillota bacterium]MDI6707047.1 GerMN domain-containing protein [Bacillota bacterium]
MHRRATLAVLVLCTAIFLAGCFNPIQAFRDWIKGDEIVEDSPDDSDRAEQDEPSQPEGDVRLRETVLYYRDNKGYLVPITRSIVWKEGIARTALEKIIEDGQDSDIAQHMGLYSAIPADTKILGLTIRDGLAKIDLSGEALDYASAEEEELMVQSVVYTLTEFNTVDEVQFMFEGKTLESLAFGTRVSNPIAREDINLIGNESGSRVTVYFLGGNETGAEYFVPVTIGVGSAGDGMDVAIKCLLEGPPADSGLVSSIPQNVKIKGMGTKNGIVYLNFEDELFGSDGSDRTAEKIVRSFALTLKEYPSVVGVKFLVDNEAAVLPSGTALESSIDVPVFANIYD